MPGMLPSCTDPTNARTMADPRRRATDLALPDAVHVHECTYARKMPKNCHFMPFFGRSRAPRIRQGSIAKSFQDQQIGRDDDSAEPPESKVAVGHPKTATLFDKVVHHLIAQTVEINLNKPLTISQNVTLPACATGVSVPRGVIEFRERTLRLRANPAAEHVPGPAASGRNASASHREPDRA
jgi:hypothetical protein